MATTLIHVSRDDLKEKIERGEEFVLVDALSPLSYATSHLPGAISMPPGHVDELASRRFPIGARRLSTTARARRATAP